jgi:hypothetical protein
VRKLPTEDAGEPQVKDNPDKPFDDRPCAKNQRSYRCFDSSITIRRSRRMGGGDEPIGNGQDHSKRGAGMISNALLSPADSCNYLLEPLGIRRTPGAMAKMRCAGIGAEFARIPAQHVGRGGKKGPPD